jgi:predicted N-acetyltransferase YhbS
MATTTVQFPIVVENADIPRVLAALRRKFGLSTGTDAEVVEALRQQFCITLEDLVFAAEEEAARDAVGQVTKINVT